MKIIGLTGWSGAGKTTLILKLIPALKARGFSVSTLKHAHHHFDVDIKGKDSYEHRLAGANEVLVASKNRFALMRELRGEDEPPLKELLTKLSPVDFVLVEGFKTAAHKKIAVHREANNKSFIAGELTHLVGVVSDNLLLSKDNTIEASGHHKHEGDMNAPRANAYESHTGVQFIHLDEINSVVQLILDEAEPLQDLLARL